MREITLWGSSFFYLNILQNFALEARLTFSQSASSFFFQNDLRIFHLSRSFCFIVYTYLFLLFQSFMLFSFLSMICLLLNHLSCFSFVFSIFLQLHNLSSVSPFSLSLSLTISLLFQFLNSLSF